jgi:hypothetical protein
VELLSWRKVTRNTRRPRLPTAVAVRVVGHQILQQTPVRPNAVAGLGHVSAPSLHPAAESQARAWARLQQHVAQGVLPLLAHHQCHCCQGLLCWRCCRSSWPRRRGGC